MRKAISIALIAAFSLTSVNTSALAQVSPMPFMPVPGVMVHLSPEYTPALLKGIVIHPENALKFDFIIYKGDKELTQEEKKQEYTKLTKYFLASLAIPDEDQWVNLSPYEKDRIIKNDFGKTEMGRDLLAQDYMLKQITASLIYPQDSLGKEFWDKVYAQAEKQYGTTNVQVNTFNKVWIVPDDALIYEKGNTAYILKNHLKVMLEEDYLSLKNHSGITSNVIPSFPTHSIASKIVREIVLPELQREVNEDKNFAPVRQVYSGMLLAAWYKRALKESLLGRIYDNKGKVKGIDQDPKTNEMIYKRYLAAYKKGVFNFIKEDTDKYPNEMVPRKYFSGGFEGYGPKDYAQRVHTIFNLNKYESRAMLSDAPDEDLAQILAEESDAAMLHNPLVETWKAIRDHQKTFNNKKHITEGVDSFLKPYARGALKASIGRPINPNQTPDPMAKQISETVWKEFLEVLDENYKSRSLHFDNTAVIKTAMDFIKLNIETQGWASLANTKRILSHMTNFDPRKKVLMDAFETKLNKIHIIGPYDKNKPLIIPMHGSSGSTAESYTDLIKELQPDYNVGVYEWDYLEPMEKSSVKLNKALQDLMADPRYDNIHRPGQLGFISRSGSSLLFREAVYLDYVQHTDASGRYTGMYTADKKIHFAEVVPTLGGSALADGMYAPNKIKEKLVEGYLNLSQRPLRWLAYNHNPHGPSWNQMVQFDDTFRQLISNHTILLQEGDEHNPVAPDKEYHGRYVANFNKLKAGRAKTLNMEYHMRSTQSEAGRAALREFFAPMLGNEAPDQAMWVDQDALLGDKRFNASFGPNDLRLLHSLKEGKSYRLYIEPGHRDDVQRLLNTGDGHLTIKDDVLEDLRYFEIDDFQSYEIVPKTFQIKIHYQQDLITKIQPRVQRMNVFWIKKTKVFDAETGEVVDKKRKIPSMGTGQPPLLISKDSIHNGTTRRGFLTSILAAGAASALPFRGASASQIDKTSLEQFNAYLSSLKSDPDKAYNADLTGKNFSPGFMALYDELNKLLKESIDLKQLPPQVLTNGYAAGYGKVLLTAQEWISKAPAIDQGSWDDFEGYINDLEEHLKTLDPNKPGFVPKSGIKAEKELHYKSARFALLYDYLTALYNGYQYPTLEDAVIFGKMLLFAGGRRDSAMAFGQTAQDKAMNHLGGIDMNAMNLHLQIKRDGNGVPLPISQQDLENIHLDGLVPILIGIKPAASLPLFSQLQHSSQSANG